MTRWRIILEVWPHSTGTGADADQKLAGEKSPYFYVDADNIKDAFKMAECIVMGLKHNPMVWEVPIFGVVKEREVP